MFELFTNTETSILFTVGGLFILAAIVNLKPKPLWSVPTFMVLLSFIQFIALAVSPFDLAYKIYSFLLFITLLSFRIIKFKEYKFIINQEKNQTI